MEEKDETVERDWQKKIEALKLGNVEREMKMSAENDKRMEGEGEEERRKRTESRMVAKLQELTAQNTFLTQKAKEIKERYK